MALPPRCIICNPACAASGCDVATTLRAIAGKRRLAGDTARAATSSEVTDLRREARQLKEVVAEQALELRLFKKSMIADGGGEE